LDARQCSSRFRQFQIPLSIAVVIDLDQSMSIRRLPEEGFASGKIGICCRIAGEISIGWRPGELSTTQNVDLCRRSVGIFRAYDGFDFSVIFGTAMQFLSGRRLA
jgi:hypothetical protein